MKSTKELEEYQKKLVEFIKNKFCSPYKVNGLQVSRNIYAEKSDISGSTLTRIKEGNGYDLPISTIYKLCVFEKISLKQFFTDFEEYLKEKQ